MDSVVFLDLRHDLRIGQSVRGLDSDETLSQRRGAAETFLEFQLGLTGPEDENGIGLPLLTAAYDSQETRPVANASATAG